MTERESLELKGKIVKNTFRNYCGCETYLFDFFT